MFRKGSLGILLIVLIFALVSSTAAQSSTIVIGSSAEAIGLDTRLSTDIYSGQRINVMMEPIIIFNTDMELEPRLATDWYFDDEATTITFEIREGVYWHDGERFTANDVKFTFDWILNPENPAPNRALYADIYEIEVVNDYLMHFHLRQPNSFLINNLARISIVPAHAADKAGFNENPIGTGPFMFESWIRDDSLSMVANPDYWGGAPKVDRLVFRTIPEDSARMFALEAGEIDVYQDQPIPEEVERLDADPNVNVQIVPGTGYRYMGFNTEMPPFDNVKVRQAFAHLIPREGIVDRLMEGLGQVATGPVPSGIPWYNPNVKTYDHNIEAARQLFDEAGVDPQGLTVHLYSHEDPTFIRIAEIIQFEAANLGINVVTHVEEWGTYWSSLQQPGHGYQMFLVDWFGQVDPDRAMFRQYHSQGSHNFGTYYNERLDYLLEKGKTVPPDSEESIAIYNEAQEILAEQSYVAYIHYYAEVGLSRASLQGFEPHPFISIVWSNAHLMSKD